MLLYTNPGGQTLGLHGLGGFGEDELGDELGDAGVDKAQARFDKFDREWRAAVERCAAARAAWQQDPRSKKKRRNAKRCTRDVANRRGRRDKALRALNDARAAEERARAEAAASPAPDSSAEQPSGGEEAAAEGGGEEAATEEAPAEGGGEETGISGLFSGKGEPSYLPFGKLGTPLAAVGALLLGRELLKGGRKRRRRR